MGVMGAPIMHLLRLDMWASMQIARYDKDIMGERVDGTVVCTVYIISSVNHA